MSTLTAFPYIGENSEATPGLWNNPFSIISDNIGAINADFFSATTVSVTSNLSVGLDLWVKGQILSGQDASITTRTLLSLGTNSNVADYIRFSDTSASRSNYILGSHVGGTADGLNIWDDSAGTMIASFSKQSIRFYQNVVGPVFDVGGALAGTYNAATFGTGADSIESRIQSAINQASIDAIPRVYVPANMYPYSASSVSFIYSVQMVREGGDWSLYDVWAYGAAGDGVQDDTVAIQQAINACGPPTPSGYPEGGIVHLSTGTYKTSSSVTCKISNVLVRGSSHGGTLIKPTAGFTGPYVLRFEPSTGLFLRDILIQDLSFDCTNLSNVTCMELFSVRNASSVVNVEIHNQNGCFCHISTSTRAGALISEGISLRDSYFITQVTPLSHGMVIDGAGEVLFSNSKIISSPVTTGLAALNLTNNAQGCVVHVGSLAGYGTGLLIDGTGANDSAYGNQAMNCTFEDVKLAVDLAGNSANSMARVNTISSNRYRGSINTIIRANFAATNTVIENEPLLASITTSIWSFTANSRNNFVMHQYNSQMAYENGDSGTNNVFVGANNGVFMIQRNGSAIQPTISIGSDSSLGWYSSGVSQVALSYGTLRLPSDLSGVGGRLVYRTATSDQTITNAHRLINVPSSANANQIGLNLHSVAAALGATNFLAFSAQNNAGAHLEYARIGAALQNVTAASERGDCVVYTVQAGTLTEVGRFNQHGQLAMVAGTGTAPSFAFSTETLLGLYRSVASTMALSYGTLDAPVVRISGQNFYVGSMSGVSRWQLSSGGLAALGVGNGFMHISASSFLASSGAVAGPTLAFNSDASTGFYLIAAQTITQSRGTLNLATNAVRLSMRTLAASALTASAANTNVAVNEAVFTVGGASGASFAIHSGGTVYIFDSTSSAKAT